MRYAFETQQLDTDKEILIFNDTNENDRKRRIRKGRKNERKK